MTSTHRASASRVDCVGALMPHGRAAISGRSDGPLSGLIFTVKDLIDVAGVPTGAGNPTWLRTHPVPSAHAHCVAASLNAGARYVGKTVTDELAYSISGDNIHYGTPQNANAPGHMPGGSSSGSAAAVAAELCDFSLATDTGGSTRLPASFCGLFGMRTTHGAISTAGIVPLMPSYDTVTWLARRFDVFEQVGKVLLPEDSATPIARFVALSDAFDAAEPAVLDALAPAMDWLADHYGRPQAMRAAEHGLEAWRQIYLQSSAYEAWQVHREWIQRYRPRFAPAIDYRFGLASHVSAAQAREAEHQRAALRALMDSVVHGAVALLPSAPFAALPIDVDEATIDRARARIFRLTCIAGLASLPQISVPVGRLDGRPVGLSLMGARGSDRQLISLAGTLAKAMNVSEGFQRIT